MKPSRCFWPLLILLVIASYPFLPLPSFGREIVLSRSDRAVFAVPYDHFVGTPTWEPDQPSTPLPTEKAVDIALEEFKRSSGFDEGIVLEISLRRIFNSVDGSRWYYSIQIVPAQNGAPQLMTYVDPLFILMDGTIVKKRK